MKLEVTHKKTTKTTKTTSETSSETKFRLTFEELMKLLTKLGGWLSWLVPCPDTPS